jgi:cytochrome c biogenesis protein CcdA
VKQTNSHLKPAAVIAVLMLCLLLLVPFAAAQEATTEPAPELQVTQVIAQEAPVEASEASDAATAAGTTTLILLLGAGAVMAVGLLTVTREVYRRNENITPKSE